MMPITPTITVGFKANHLLQGRFNQAHVSHLWKQLIRPKRKKKEKEKEKRSLDASIDQFLILLL